METPVTSLRIPMGTRTALAALAKVERRSFANYVNRILEEHLEAQGLMLCPDCMGAAVLRLDEDGHPDLCDTCDGFGHVKVKK
jgi:hypothetical protein